MTQTNDQHRQPRGIPVGGEFAALDRGGSGGVTLRSPARRPFWLEQEDYELWDLINHSADVGEFPSMREAGDRSHLVRVGRLMSQQPQFASLDLHDPGDGSDTILLFASDTSSPGLHTTTRVSVLEMFDGDSEISGAEGAFVFAKNVERQYNDLKMHGAPLTTSDIVSQAQVLDMMSKESTVKYTSDEGLTIRHGTIRSGLYSADGAPVASAVPNGAFVRITTNFGTQEYFPFKRVAQWIDEGAVAAE